MKTAISLDDNLMAEADAEAQELGMSRSALFAEAMREYLLRLRQARITRQLNEVYKDGQDADERQLTRAIKKKFTPQERW